MREQEMAGRSNDVIGSQKIDGICQNFVDSNKTDGSLSSTSDNLNPLPENWKKAYTENGEPYFIDYSTGTSQWQDPRLGKLNLGMNNSEETDIPAVELPYGWEKIEDPHYGTYYIDHVNKTTQYESPTLHTIRPVQQEEVNNSSGWRQVNDSSMPGSNINTNSDAPDSQSLQSQEMLYTSNRKLSTPGSDRNMRLPELNCNNAVQKLPYIFTRNPYELRGEMIQTMLVKSGRGFGFTIVGGDNGEVEEFLQIKNIVPQGPAWQNGVLQTGDVLVYVNNTCVLGYTHQDVVTLFQSMSPGDNVQLEVCRGYPLPFDLSDPNAEVVSTMAVSMTQSPENRPSYPSGGGDNEKESYYKLDEGSDSARSAKSMPDLRNSNHSKIQRHNSADILDTTMSDEIATYNQQGCDNLEYITVEIIKGNNGFGFTIADSGCGQKVKKILDKSRCKSLQEGDILLEINGKSVADVSHTDVVLMLKECPCGEGACITVQRGVPKGNKFPRSYENNSYQMDGNSNLLSQSLMLPDKLKQKDLSVPSVPGLYRSKTPTADLYSSRNKEPIPINRPKTPLVDSRNWFPTDPCRAYNGTLDHEILSMWKTGFRIKSPNSPQTNWSVAQDQGYWSNKNFQECNNAQDCSTHDDVRLPSYKEIVEMDDDPKSIHNNSRSLYSNNWNRNNLGNLNASPQSYPNTYSNRSYAENSYHMYHSECGDHHPLHDNVSQQQLVSQESNSCNLHYQYSSNHSLSPTRTNNSFDQEQQPLLSKTMGDDAEYNLYGGQSPQERMPVSREMVVTLHRQESGFGFRIVGGTEEGSQVSIGHIVPGGSADLDGRLQPGDEIISVDGQSVINTTHHQVVQLMGSASTNDRVTLGIRRKLPVRDIDKLQDSYHSNCSGNIYPYNVTVTRKQHEGFGFVIISSVSRIGSTIGRILESSPAERCSHLHVGDRILAVNGVSIINMHHGDIVNLIKDSGYSVTLTIGAPQDDESSTTSNSQKGEEIHRDQQRYHSIELVRGTRGFGFSIRGGQEFQNMPLYVLRIAENGPAHQDGKLQHNYAGTTEQWRPTMMLFHQLKDEHSRAQNLNTSVGDQIMEINGVNTAGMTHSEAIEIIRQGVNSVHLLVKRHDKLPAVIANNPGSLPPEYYSINTHNEMVR